MTNKTVSLTLPLSKEILDKARQVNSKLQEEIAEYVKYLSELDPQAMTCPSFSSYLSRNRSVVQSERYSDWNEVRSTRKPTRHGRDENETK